MIKIGNTYHFFSQNDWIYNVMQAVSVAIWKESDLKVVFFRKYDAFFTLPKKIAENYPEKDILKLCSV